MIPIDTLTFRRQRSSELDWKEDSTLQEAIEMDDLVSKPHLEEVVQSAGARLMDAVDGLLKGDPQPAMGWMESYIGPAILALGLVIIAYFIAKLVSRVASKPICHRVDETLGRFVGKLIFHSIIVGTVLAVLGKFGVDVTSFAAVLGAMGFAIGLAFQGTLSNFAAGILLMVFRPFKVGDNVVAGAVAGKVNEIDLFTTTLDTPDNRRIIVPNSAIAGSTIENITHHAHRRVDIVVGVAYECGVEETRKALGDACESQRKWLVDEANRGYQILMHQLGPSSVDWMVRFWTIGPNYPAARESLLVAIKVELDRNAIKIPFPQLEIHFASSPAIDSGPKPTLTRIRPERVA